MTWWQTLIVATVPAFVTLVGLMIQQANNNRREDRRRDEDAQQRERDRKHQSEQAEAERNHQVALIHDDRNHEASQRWRHEVSRQNAADRERAERLTERWREERKDAHIALLARIDFALRALDNALMKLPSDDASRTIRTDAPLDALPVEEREGLRTALAAVQVMASSATKDKAEECLTKLFGLDTAIWAASLGGDNKDLLHTRAATCERLRVEYVAAVRADLGTDASDPGPSLDALYEAMPDAWVRDPDPWETH